MKKGQKVRWTSQSKGHITTKEGVIFAVVPAGSPATAYGYYPNGGPAGYPRNHESYIVKIENRTYWPRVCQLQLIEEMKGA